MTKTILVIIILVVGIGFGYWYAGNYVVKTEYRDVVKTVTIGKDEPCPICVQIPCPDEEGYTDTLQTCWYEYETLKTEYTTLEEEIKTDLDLNIRILQVAKETLDTKVAELEKQNLILSTDYNIIKQQLKDLSHAVDMGIVCQTR